MRVTLLPIVKSVLEFEVAVPHEEYASTIPQAAQLLSEGHEIEGFRKGKAPYEIVKSTLGEQAIYERAADLVIRRYYPEALALALKESKTTATPIGHPEISLTKLAPGNELLFKVRISLLPQIILPDYKKIAARTLEKEKKDIAVNEADVTRATDWLRESRATEIAVDRPAEKDDAVEIDFSIRHGGVKIEGGESRNHPLVIGKGKFIPGFEDKLIGMSKGEEKTVTLVVPDSWHDRDMRGKTLDITTTMKEIRERKPPELTDEFAATIGTFDSKEKLLESVRAGLTEEKKEKERERIRMRIIEEIAHETKIDIPDILVEAELGKMFEELKSGITQMGMKWEDYLVSIKKTADELAHDWRQEAEKRARVALLLREIATKESIIPDEEEVKKRADEYLTRYKSVKEATKDIDPQTLREYTRGVLRNEKVFEYLESLTNTQL